MKTFLTILILYFSASFLLVLYYARIITDGINEELIEENDPIMIAIANNRTGRFILNAIFCLVVFVCLPVLWVMSIFEEDEETDEL